LVEGVDGDRERERLCRAAHAPLRGSGLDDVERLIAALRFRAHDMPSEVAQQIATGDPRRQGEPLLGSRVVDAAFDLEPVPIQIGQTNAVANQSASPLHEQRSPSGLHCRIAALC
jgi:hypothetical protein